MRKPEALQQLIEDLKSEGGATSVEVQPESKAVIYLDDQAAEDSDGITLAGAECLLVFSSEDAVDRLMEALDYPKEASLNLFDVSIPGCILDALESHFIAVDEG